MKINLGCGRDIRRGYVNVDFRQTHDSVVLANVMEGLPFDDECADEVLALDFLEHFPTRDLVGVVLPEILRLLRPGGVMVARMPDLQRMLSDYNAGVTNDHETARRIHGGQDYHGNTHYWSYTDRTIGPILLRAGFVNFKRTGSINWNMDLRAEKPA